MTEHAMTHREPIAALAVHLDDHRADDTAAPGGFEVLAVVVSAIYPDGTVAAVPTVDLRAPNIGLDEHGRLHLSADQADALADALTRAAVSARHSAQR